MENQKNLDVRWEKVRWRIVVEGLDGRARQSTKLAFLHFSRKNGHKSIRYSAWSRPHVSYTPLNKPKLIHSRPIGTPADTTRESTPAPIRNGAAGRRLAPAPC